jgi:hypothetical protein
MLLRVPSAVALLRQLHTTLRVRVAQEQYLDLDTDCQIWKLTATSATGEVWTARHEDRCKAAGGLAELMGFELGDG